MQNSHSLLVGMQNDTAAMENSMEVLITELRYGPGIPLLSIYSKELKLESQRDIITTMFSATIHNSHIRYQRRPDTEDGGFLLN